jgi:NADPH:quinone reductase-like Zn-dependent oxidoreductase
MRVYQVQSWGLDGLTLVDQPEPQPGAGQVLVRVRACSLNYRDLLVTKGMYNPKMRLPIVPLSDGAGEVAAVGPGVTRVKVGDRVAGAFMQQWIEGELTDAKGRSALGGGGTGMLAEYVVLEAEGVVPVPAHLSFEEAATLPCAAVTVWHALVTEGRLHAGATILIQGTGGVSIFALQFARLHGARVIAISSSDQKLERVRQLGASDGINYKTTAEWDKPVREHTGGVGVDHVVEVGGAGTMDRSLRSVRAGGQISLIGVLAAGGQFNPMPILMKCIRVQGIYVGSRAMFEAMNRAIMVNQLRPVIDRTFPFAEAPEALRYMESGAHFGKVCVKVGE